MLVVLMIMVFGSHLTPIQILKLIQILIENATLRTGNTHPVHTSILEAILWTV